MHRSWRSCASKHEVIGPDPRAPPGLEAEVAPTSTRCRAWWTATGRLHTTYQQAVAATGRLSSTDPNLQNIPIRTALGRRIRRAFVAPPGKLLLGADYSQQELRILAHVSGDAGLKADFAAHSDIHLAAAARVLGLQAEQVDAARFAAWPR